MTREHASLAGRESIAFTPEVLATFDVALICTDHDDVDYQQLVDSIPLVCDSRNVTKNITHNRDRIVLV